MKAMKIRRVAAAAGVAAFAAIAPIAAATPASAMYSGCLNYVQSHGYVVGPKVYSACSITALNGGVFWIANPACTKELIAIKVSSGVAGEACRRAHG
ncbi:hypothetical protein ACFRFJ_40240 [Streptomyces hydrogenans]|uniref:hypothetical protein n=1 Tax=Streptomyces hydrogenans TaxID=1873719 RepID=UPI00368AB916